MGKTDISPNKTYKWLTNTWKDTQHLSLLEKCKSKLQWDNTLYQSEWPSIKKSTNSKCWRWCGEKGTFWLCWCKCKFIQPLWNMVWRFLKKLGIKSPAVQFSLLRRVWLFATPWTAEFQASLSITNSQSLPKPISIESVMPSNHLNLWHPRLLVQQYQVIRGAGS